MSFRKKSLYYFSHLLIMHAIPLTALAGLGYLYFGAVDPHVLTQLLMGSLPAILIGSMLAQKIPGRLVKLVLAAMLFFAGLKLFQSFF